VSQTGDGDVRSEMSGRAGDVVQARDVSGGVHFHQRISVIPRPSQLPGQHAARQMPRPTGTRHLLVTSRARSNKSSALSRPSISSSGDASSSGTSGRGPR